MPNNVLNTVINMCYKIYLFCSDIYTSDKLFVNDNGHPRQPYAYSC